MLIATIAATVVAIVLSIFKRGLFTVAMSATVTVLVLILVLRALGLS